MIRVLVADHRASQRERLRAALVEDMEIEVAGLARDGQEALRLAHALCPEVVLLAADLPGCDGFAAAELLASSGLPLDCILLADEKAEEETLRRAMQAGARDVLAGPPDAAALRRAVCAVHAGGLRRRSPQFAAEADLRGSGRLFAVTSAKGGVGKTTLAVNLAAALATATGEPTVLLDLHTQFADAAFMLNLTPRRTLADWVGMETADQEEQGLDDHLERHACGLRVLAGASAPLPAGALTLDRLDRLLSLLGRSSRYTVLDVPPLLSEATRHALSHAASVLVVANLHDLTTLADTNRWLEAVSGQYVAREACRIVLNRVSPRSRLQVPDIERVLSKSVDWLVPNDGKIVPSAVNAGVPFVLSHPGSRVAQSVARLAQSLARGEPRRC